MKKVMFLLMMLMSYAVNCFAFPIGDNIEVVNVANFDVALIRDKGTADGFAVNITRNEKNPNIARSNAINNPSNHDPGYYYIAKDVYLVRNAEIDFDNRITVILEYYYGSTNPYGIIRYDYGYGKFIEHPYGLFGQVEVDLVTVIRRYAIF